MSRPKWTLKNQVFEEIGESADLKKQEIEDSTRLKTDLSYDSLDHIELAMRLEEVFDIEILDLEIENITTALQVFELVEKKVNEKTKQKGEEDYEQDKS